MTDRRLRSSAWRPLAAILCVLTHCIAQATPPQEQTLITPGLDLRLFVGSPQLSGVTEVEYRQELADRHYRSFRAGVAGYILLGGDWALRWGASLWREYGVLIESDWQKLNGTWQWIRANDRPSDSVSADLTPRLRLGQLLVGELRVRYQHGIGQDRRRSFKIRPGLQWSIRSDGAPFIETFLQAEAYFTASERASNPYEVWTYASALWHAWPGALIGPKVAFRGSSFAGQTGAGAYEISSTTWALGLVGVFSIR